MEPTSEKSLDPRRYVRIVWRRRWVIVLCAVVVLAASAVALSFMPSQYQSEVTLLIEDRQPLAAEIEQVMGGWRAPTSAGTRLEEERLSRMVGRIRSRPFLERVIKILKMDEDPRVREEARKRRAGRPELTEDEMTIRLLTRALAGRITFGSVGPGIYKIIVTDASPENSQLLAKWISELFVDITIQKELEYIRNAREFGEEQRRVYENQLRRSEEALERYQGSLIEQNLSGKMVTAANLPSAEALQRRMAEEAAVSMARVAPLSRSAIGAGMGPGGDPRITNDPAVVEVSRRISQALAGAARDLLATDRPDLTLWPPKGQVDVLRRDLYREVEERTRDLYPDASTETLRAIAGYTFAEVDASCYADIAEVLDLDIAAFKRRAQTGPEDEMELARLEEDVRKNRELLQSFQAQLVASDVSQAVETTNLGLRMEIIDPAQIPLSPSRPNRSRILMAAVLMGPLVGVGFAFLGEFLDPTLRTLDDIKRAAPEPVFGVLPRLSTLKVRRSGWRRYWVPASVGGVLLLTALFFAARATVLKEVAVIGEPVQMVDPGEGVSP